jgi:hypothetical protein
MDYILELFETKKVEFKDDPVLGPCINSGWSKLVKYYEKTSDSPAYVAALVLNPAYKWEYIDKNWEQKLDTRSEGISCRPMEGKISTQYYAY